MGASTASLKGYSLAGTVNYPAIALDPGEVTVLSSSVSNPGGVAVDSLGNWYVADTGNDQILKNGQVLVGGLNAPQGVAVDGAGNVYIADTGNNLVKEWNALTGAVTTVAGGGTPCSVASLVTFSSDSLGNNCLATQATLNHPTALAVDTLLNLYILDQGNAEIRRVDPKSKAITLVAGGSGANIPECAGYNPHPRCATLASPVALAVGAPGLVYVVEAGSSNDIKEINLLSFPATISMVATNSSFTNPSGVGVDAAGNIYYADAGYQVVGMANASGSAVDQLVLGIAGTTGGSAIAPGSVANTVALNGPAALAVDPSGNVYISDINNNRILKVDRTQSAIQFGEVAPGTGVVSSNITATNIGTQPLVLQPLSVSGTNASDFNIKGSCSTTLAAGASCDVAALAQPTDSGSLDAAVVFSSNAINTPTIQLTASVGGTPTSTELSFVPFGPTYCGQPTTMVATVTPASCTGKVSFVINGELVSSVPVQSGTASLTFPWSDHFLSVCSNMMSYALYDDPSGACAGSEGVLGTTPSLNLTCTWVIYDGNPHSCTGTATGLGGVPVKGTWSFSPASETNAGSYQVTGTFTSGDPSYTSGTASGLLVIYPALPTSVTAECPTVVFDGNSHSCTATAIGVSGTPVSGTFAFTPGSETAVGSYWEMATFTSTDPNYANDPSITIYYPAGTLTIDPATPRLTVTCATLDELPAFTGAGHTCTGLATGVNGNPVSGSWSFNPASVIAAGTYTVTGTFTSSDPDYSGGTATGTLPIVPATPTVTVSCPTVVYDGTAHSCAATATGVGGAAVSGSFTFSPGNETTVGSYLEEAAFTSSDPNYSPGYGSGTLVINAAAAGTPAATFSTTAVTFPSSIMIGQSSPAQYVTIVSTGTASLFVSGVTIGGANPGDFAATNQAGTCTTGASLVYHADCNLRVIFTPTAVGTRSAIIYINDNLVGSPQQVVVSGTAISGAQLSLSATTLTFPATTVGSTAATQYLTLKSTGFQPVIINQVVLSSGDFDLSDQAGTCTTAATTSLVPGASCNIRVKFHPTATGARTATVTINDNTATSPHTVTLNGTGQ
jgi:hypothetical protein